MTRKLIDALILIVFACAGSCRRSRRRRRRGDRIATHRERAADLKDCCTPGDRGLPQGRRQSRQPELLGAAADQQARGFAGSAPPGSTASKAASPPAPTRARRSSSTACSTSSRRSATWSPSTAGPAPPSGNTRRPRGNLTRRGVAVGQGLVYTLGRQLRRRARQGHRRGRLGAAARRLRQRREGRGRLPRRHAVHRHQRRRPRRGARARRHQRRRALALLGRARARRVRQRHLGRRLLAGQAAPTPWIHPGDRSRAAALVYWTFGNVRGGSSQNGSTRGGDNLFANSIVALDIKTGAYKWHFQSIHHDIWDMDNVMAPVLADVEDPRPRAQARRLRQQVRHVLHPRPPRRQRAARHRRGAGAAGAAPEDLADAAVPAPGRLDRELRRRPAARHRGSRRPEPRGAQLRAAAACTPRTGTCRSCRSPATAAAPTGTTSRSARAPAWSTPASATSPRRTR